jgi:hypothetical protein
MNKISRILAPLLLTGYVFALLTFQGLYTTLIATFFFLFAGAVLFILAFADKKKNTHRAPILLSMTLVGILLVDALCYSASRNASLAARLPAPLLKVLQYHYGIDRNILQFEFGSYNPEVSYLMKPGEWTFRNVEFSHPVVINSVGIRDDEQSLTQPEVIVLGDSIAAGWGVGVPFAQRLEEQPDHPRTVLNAAVSSFGTVREITLLNTLDVSNLQTLIIQYHWNDQRENQTYHSENALSISTPKQWHKAQTTYQRRKKYIPGKYFFNTVVALIYPAPPNHPQQSAHFLYPLKNLPEGDYNIIVLTLDDRFKTELDAELTLHPITNHSITVVSTEGFLDEADGYVLDDHFRQSGHDKIAEHLQPLLTPTTTPTAP